jgi:alpha-galactosidase
MTGRFAGETPALRLNPSDMNGASPSRCGIKWHASQSQMRAPESAAPLILGMDLRQVDEAMLKIILNRDVIALDHDPLGILGRRIRRDGKLEGFARRLTDGEALVLLNRGKEPAEMRVAAGELGSPKNAPEARDRWTGQRRSITDGVISARVEGHGVAMLRMTGSL